ncbi:Uncharacterised protein [Klebsiella pneumoniae]|nr:Uncharacterised protein [Klebsiella pneumoniae]
MVADHRRDHLQAGDNAIAGGGFIQQDHMAGVFRTDAPAFFLEHLQYIAVTDLRAGKRDA